LAASALSIVPSYRRSGMPKSSSGHAPLEFSPAYTIISMPGHTRGHCVLLYQRRFFFTDDHLWWSRVLQRLAASREYCWYSLTEQEKSMERLRAFAFDWVLRGHGQRIKLC
jgi:glyoxylase-like metal-dependent hydrolase (beta-lactamase superfamily II)